MKSWAISLTRRWKGSLRIRSSVLFWYLRISRRATVPGPVTVGLLHSSGGRGTLTGSLGGQLFARSLSSCRFTGSLLSTGHCKVLQLRMNKLCLSALGYLYGTAVTCWGLSQSEGGIPPRWCLQADFLMQFCTDLKHDVLLNFSASYRWISSKFSGIVPCCWHIVAAKQLVSGASVRKVVVEMRKS